MRITFCSFCFLLTMISGNSQTTDTMVVAGDTMIVFTANSPADELFRSGDVFGAIESYRSMSKNGEQHKTEYYNYACALAVAHQVDSAFKYLFLASKDDDSPYAFCDPDFLNLRKDPRWVDFENGLLEAIQRNTPIADVSYAKRLWYMKATDQAYYKEIRIAEDKTGANSTVVLALWKLKQVLNDLNQKELEELIAIKGWPKYSQVGQEAGNAAFLVIQHSNTDLQKEYLPVIKQLCETNEASWGSYALMYDRIEMHENRPQKYGSQVRFNTSLNKYELYPLIDETKVDQWRMEIGMGPLSEYLKRWDIEFDPKNK